MWVNAPAQVAQLRTQLMNCAVLQTPPFNLSEDQYHYPNWIPAVTPTQAELNAELQQSAASPDNLPAIEIAMVDSDRPHYAEGAQGLFRGDIVINVVADTLGSDASCPNVGVMESLCEQIVLQLKLQYFGMHFRNIRKGLATDLEAGQVAAQNDTPGAGYISQKIICECGLERGRTS